MSEWIDVRERLPEPHMAMDMLVWCKNQSAAGGFRDIAAYGEYVYWDDGVKPEDPAYVENHDDGNCRKFGWHREEETHGGEYDYVFVGLDDRVTHWMPLPSPPERKDVEA